MLRLFCWLIMASTLLMGCGQEPPRQGVGQTNEDRIRVLVERLRDGGIDCKNLTIRGSGEDTSGQPLSSAVANAYGYCQLSEAPIVKGRRISSRILVFSDASHLDTLPRPEYLQGQALVYDDEWEFYVVPSSMGDDVQEVLGGNIVLFDQSGGSSSPN